MPGRPVKIRVSYVNDAAYLSRLSDAIERDPKRDTEWKREACSCIQQLVGLFMEPITGYKPEKSTPPITDDTAAQ